MGNLLGIITMLCLVGMPLQAHAAKAAKAKAVPAKTARSAPTQVHKAPAARSSSGGHGLAHEWEPVSELKSYKKNYLLVYSLSNNQNNLPTSTNPSNQVLIPYALDIKEAKFQISVKHVLADFQEYGALWLAYTQRSFWQLYDVANSRPFRENNYEPEFIYSLRPNEASIFNFGYVHQSNGESNPRSRSWDRVYVQPGVEFSNGGGARIILLARWWERLQENFASDDNPDIVNYLGYREFELRYIEDGDWEIAAISRINSFQLDIAAPWTSWLGLSNDGDHNGNVHLQYFKGYGESLLDYNQSHVSWGVGLSFPFE